MRKSPVRSMMWRRFIVVLLLLVQIIAIIYFLYNSSNTSKIAGLFFNLLSVIAVVYVLNRQHKNAYKILWIVMILVFPIFGGLFFLMFGYQVRTKKFKKLLRSHDDVFRHLFIKNKSVLPEAKKCIPEFDTYMTYLESYAGYPVYGNTHTVYFKSGELFFESAKKEIMKAERYVFLEFFIIEPGEMLDKLLDLLEEKVRQGVDVRIMYDDIGCFLRLPRNYKKTLENRGFKCVLFNPFSPMLSTTQNNRDHRKIISIDGKTAFTGGVNLADEYINVIEKYGHWRDAAILVHGEAAWSLTLIFLQMWSSVVNTVEDYDLLYPWRSHPCGITGDGFVQPYADSPMDGENLGEHVYIQIINKARDYLYISTPYLIIDESVVSSLSLAAKSGVDVRIITPHIWDKRLAYVVTRSYYRELIEAGVKIYEYTIGFNHSKTFVSDDRIATVGTTNMDYRSLYLHFECGVVLYGCKSVKKIKEDIIDTLGNCEEITLDNCRARPSMRLLQNILRIFAPLM